MTRAFQIMSSQRKKLSFEEKETHLWKSVLHKSSQMVFEQYKILSELEEDLKFYNLKRIGPSLLSKKEKKMIEELFDTSILPLLNPANIKDLNFKSLQNNQLNIALILKDNYGIYSFITIEVPDKLQMLPIHPFRTAGTHVRAYASPVFKIPLEIPQQALPPGKIQVDNGVALFQSCVHGAAVVAVDDPLVHVQGHGQPGVKLLLGHVLPARRPPQPV